MSSRSPRLQKTPSVKLFMKVRTANVWLVKHKLFYAKVIPWGAAYAIEYRGRYLRTDGTLQNPGTNIKNSASRIWTPTVMNKILSQLRKLKGMKVVRDNIAGTVVVSAKKKDGTIQEYVRGLRHPSGQWIVRFDTKLITSAMNPGAKWHEGRANELRTSAEITRGSISFPAHSERFLAQASENEYAAEESRRRGMNPRKKLPKWMQDVVREREVERHIERIRTRGKKKNPGEFKSFLPMILFGTAIIIVVSLIGRKATES